MDALVLLLLDSRAPAGAHAHSMGMEPAVTAGHVRDLAGVEAFCRGRLATTATVGAAFAATAHRMWRTQAPAEAWELLDAEFDARTPSEAGRLASRQLGSGLRRLLRSMRPAADFDSPWVLIPRPGPHHPVALGAALAEAGADQRVAAQAAALSAITAPASAAVRLLGLDPLAVQAMLARLGPLVDSCADETVTAGAAADLPALSAPALELLADVHHTAEVRLFAS